MISVLDTIIEKENSFVSRKKIPKSLKLSYKYYRSLIKEIEQTKYMGDFHGMKITLIDQHTIILE